MYKKIVEFGPSISSENIGDHLTVSMPTSSYLTKRNLKYVDTSDYSFVCGINLLASKLITCSPIREPIYTEEVCA